MNPTTVSLFCGAGGESLGKHLAFEELGLNVRDMDAYAVNHWDLAVAAHGLNLPWIQVRQEDITEVTAADFGLAGRSINLLWASPSCTHHSRARGGKPKDDQQRSHADEVLDRWIRISKVDVVLIENVPEFQEWGPLDENGTVIPERKGEFFRAFVEGLRGLGYEVEWRVLCAADYGDPTTRRRFFLQAARDGHGIHWPDPTHRDPKRPSGLFDADLPQWRTAAEIIDWSLPVPSIFDRKRPLADATLRRIAAGIQRFVLQGQPYIVGVGGRAGQSRPRGLDEPYGTLTTKADAALIAPCMVSLRGTAPDQIQASAGSVESPVPTISAGGGHAALCAAFLSKHFTGVVGQEMEQPLSTVTAVDHHSLGVAFLSSFYGHKSEHGDARGCSPDSPIPTIPTNNRHALVATNLIGIDNQSGAGVWPADAPLTTATGKARHALVAAFIQHYYGTGGQHQDPGQPLHTITTLARHGLVTVEIDGETYVITDIGMRMLDPQELARAMGFPEWYRWEGPDGKLLTKRDRVKMIGNAVPTGLAKALVKAVVLARPEAFGLVEEVA